MTQISDGSLEMFKKAVAVIEKAWLYSTDDDDAEATNELMGDLLREIEDFLGDYKRDMGN